MTVSIGADPDDRRSGRALAIALNLVGAAAALGLAVLLADALTTGQELRGLAVVGLAAVLLALAVDPALGLLGWLALAPFGRLFNLAMGRGLPDLGLNRVAALFLLLLLIAQVAAGKRRLGRVTPIEWAGALFLVGMLLSVPASRLGIVGGLQNLFDTVALPLFCFLFARALLGSEQGLRRLAITLALIGAVLGLIAVREQLTNQAILSPLPYRWAYGEHSVKVTSLFGAPAIMALTLALPLPVVFLAAVRARGPWTRVAWGAALAAMAAGLLLTYVRAGWLAAVIGAGVVIALSRRARRAALWLAPVALILALLFGGGVFDARAIQERFSAEGPIDYRVQALTVGLQIAARAPLFGLGLDNYSDAAIAAGWRPISAIGLPAVAAHNLFIYVLTSAGLIALLPLLTLFALIGWRAFQLWRRRRTSSAALPDPDWLAAALGTWAGYLLFANTIDALGAQLANMLFFLIMGAVLGAYENVPPSTGARRVQFGEPAVPEGVA